MRQCAERKATSLHQWSVITVNGKNTLHIWCPLQNFKGLEVLLENVPLIDQFYLKVVAFSSDVWFEIYAILIINKRAIGPNALT
jgi:hypothetical protein